MTLSAVSKHNPTMVMPLSRRQTSIRFSGKNLQEKVTRAAAGQAPVNIGALKTLKILFWDYPRKGVNGPLVKGILFHYVIPILSGATWLLGPLGWAAGLITLPIASYCSKEGEAILNKLKLEKKQGPLPSIVNMHKLWDEMSTENRGEKATQIVNTYNRLLKDLLNDTKHVPEIGAVVRKLHLNPEKGVGRWVRNTVVVVSAYRQKWIGRVLTKTLKWGKRVPLLRPFILVPALALNGLFILLHLPFAGLSAATKQALRHA